MVWSIYKLPTCGLKTDTLSTYGLTRLLLLPKPLKKKKKLQGHSGRGNYLNPSLSPGFKEALDFFNQAVADHIKYKGVNYVRRYFCVENDFDPEEEDLRKKNDWVEGIEEN